VSGDAPLCLLLLDGVLEESAFAARGRDLLRAPAVVAVEPARRAPGLLADRVARRLVRRLSGEPRMVVLLSEAQRPLARALLARHPGCELVEIDPAGPAGGAPFQANAGLWDRLEALGIARR
jgi:hypothetical protein